jgi:hypothetical protein
MEKERLKEAANAEKMTEGGRFWAERTKGEAMVEKIRQARAGVEDVFDVGDLGGRTRNPGRLPQRDASGPVPPVCYLPRVLRPTIRANRPPASLIITSL